MGNFFAAVSVSTNGENITSSETSTQHKVLPSTQPSQDSTPAITTKSTSTSTGSEDDPAELPCELLVLVIIHWEYS